VLHGLDVWEQHPDLLHHHDLLSSSAAHLSNPQLRAE
jgi:hypothetical protein